MDGIEKQALLSAHYLFRDLPAEAVERVARMSVTSRYKAGAVLFFKGDGGDALYGVLQGRIRISTSSPAGKEVTLSIMEPGDVFGEIALLDGGPRTADATAQTDADLLVIHRRDFVDYLRNEPALAIHLLRMVCERLRYTSQRIEDLAFLDLPARLAKRLLSLADDVAKTGPVEIHISQSELGHFLGTTRESVNKHLQRWKRDGWIDLERSTIHVLDREALRELVAAEIEP